MRPWLSCWCCYKLHCTTTSVKTATSSQPLRSKSCQNAKLTLCEEMNIIHHCNCVGKLEAANASLVDQRWLQWQSMDPFNLLGWLVRCLVIKKILGTFSTSFVPVRVLISRLLWFDCTSELQSSKFWRRVCTIDSCTRVQRTPLAATIHVHSSCHQVVQETNSVNFTFEAA